MIKSINISGFKSLLDFSIDFQKGLNVLIGPNGAGKTNICQALKLVASIANEDLGGYVLSIGGTSAACTDNCFYDDSCNLKNTIEVSCIGERLIKENEKEISLRYKYSFILDLSDEPKLTVENLSLYKKSRKNRYRIILKATREKENSFEIEIKNKKEIGSSFSSELMKKKNWSFRPPVRDRFFSFIPLLGSLFYYCFIVKEDMAFSKAWNIDPHIAKIPSDVLEPSTMLPDGKRLANCIASVYRNMKNNTENINEYLSSIIPSFEKIETVIPYAGKRSFELIDKNGVRCPANNLSDGTIKIIALIIGIFSQVKSTSIIEEPENFLHPWVSQSLIEFFRENFTDGVCILTTHSETILNSILPNEIIIVENPEGKTKITRIKDKERLSYAIKKSGFGCGYHYISGSIGGTPL